LDDTDWAIDLATLPVRSTTGGADVVNIAFGSLSLLGYV